MSTSVTTSKRWALLGLGEHALSSAEPREPASALESLARATMAFDSRDPIEAILLGVTADLRSIAQLLEPAVEVPERLHGTLWSLSNRVEAAIQLLGICDAQETRDEDRPQPEYRICVSREKDGRWRADVPALPGCCAYAEDRTDAQRSSHAAALRALADRFMHPEAHAPLRVAFRVALYDDKPCPPAHEPEGSP